MFYLKLIKSMKNRQFEIKLEKAIVEKYNFDVPVIVRTVEALKENGRI